MTRSAALSLCIILAATMALHAAPPRIAADSAGVRSLAASSDRTAVARGGVFEIQGQGLGPAPAPDAETGIFKAEAPYPLEFVGVSVAIYPSDGDAAASAGAYLVSVSERRIVAQLPSTLPPGAYRAIVTFNGEKSEPSAVFKVADSNPGIVVSTGGNSGLAAGQIVPAADDQQAPSPITLANAASPGITIQLDLTGFARDEASGTPENEPQPENNLFPEAVILIGELEVPISYLGPNPNKPGYFLLTATLPSEGLPTSCLEAIRIRLNADATLDGPVYLPLRAAGEPFCKHPNGVTDEGLATLAAGGSIVRGSFTLVRVSGESSSGGMTFRTVSDQLSGGFVRYTAEEIAEMAIRSLSASKVDPETGCVIFDEVEGVSGGVFVDAGPNIKLTDPVWNHTVARGTGVSLNQYNVSLSSFFNGAPIPGVPTAGLIYNPGPHNITGPGGAVVGPFSVDINASPAMRWTNMDATTEVDTSKDLVFTHSGAGAEDTIAATGTVHGPAPEDTSRMVKRAWICYSKGGAGRVVVPSSLLRKLPRVTAAELANSRSGRYSSLAIGSYNPEGEGVFRAPLTEGGLTERAVFLFNYTWAKTPVPVR
jgi:uncharacterized protein (TIGR03437 family)